MTIVTHGGTAHADEVMSIALLVLRDEHVRAAYRRQALDIKRVANFMDDTIAPGDWVLDVGLIHDPERLRFDHHQQRPPVDSTFSLLAKHFGLHETLSTCTSWYNQIVCVDVHGPIKYMESLGFSDPTMDTFTSVFSTSILQWFVTQFERLPIVGIDLAVPWLTERISEAQSIRLRVDELLDTASVFGNVVVFPDAATPFGTGLAIRELVSRSDVFLDIAVSILPDSRDKGMWSLMRLDDDARVDMLRIEELPFVEFVHANGFLAKVRCSLPEAIQLAQQTIREDDEDVWERKHDRWLQGKPGRS